MATSPEKRMRVLPSLRIGESLENALMRLAARDERTLSGYIERVPKVVIPAASSNGSVKPAWRKGPKA